MSHLTTHKHREYSYLRAYKALPLPVIYVPIRHRYLCAYKAPSTTVESPLQISSFMQNKANFPDDPMNVNKVLTKDYGNISNCKLCENKANTKPIKANLLNAQMNINKILTKDYENKRLGRLRENKANTNPIQTQTKPISKVRNVQKTPREIPNKNIGTGVGLNTIEFGGELTESQNKLWCQQSGQNGRSGPFRGIRLKAS